MPQPIRTLVACAIVVFVWGGPPRATAGDDRAPYPHIRCVDSAARDILRDGNRRSATFRRLAGEIEQSDIIVYVQAQSILDVPVDAHLQMVAATPAVRFLRILVKIPTGADNAVALLGHELQHVTEIAHNQGVRDEHSLADLYRRIGFEHENGWETKAARLVDYVIREELRAKQALADSR